VLFEEHRLFKKFRRGELEMPNVKKLCHSATGEEVEYLQLQWRLHRFFVNACAFGCSGSWRVGTPM